MEKCGGVWLWGRIPRDLSTANSNTVGKYFTFSDTFIYKITWLTTIRQLPGIWYSESSGEEMILWFQMSNNK